MSRFAAVPEELRVRHQWVVWRLELIDGKLKKMPYRAGRPDVKASSTAPATWATFEQAVAAADRDGIDGIGYVFAADDPFVGVDMDDGLPEADRAAIMLALDSYTETSQSGTGAHVIVRADMNGHPVHRRGGLEVYQEGRYFVMTGDHVVGTPATIEERQAELEQVLAHYLPKPAPVERAATPATPVDLDDRDLLKLALRARNGRAFDALWQGDTAGHGGDHSAADLDLAGRLAFWTGRDPDRIDRLFRMSGLMRDKWERADYRERTIAKAIEGCRDVYTPPARDEADDDIAEAVQQDIDANPALAARAASGANAKAGMASFGRVVGAVRHYMDVTDEEVAYLAVALAVGVAAHLQDEEPLWVMLVGQSGGGKTEAIRLLTPVADKQVDELTRAGLLSWTTSGKRGKRTGLLTEIPANALVTISDFSTVITTGDREARARMFGMLRVVYDGRVYRSIGGQASGGADPLEWEGHLTLLAGATNAIDTHLSFEASLGERWLLFRLPESSLERSKRRTVFSVDRENTADARRRAQQLAGDLIRQARPRIPGHLDAAIRSALIDAAVFAAHARTGVQFEGTGKYRVVIGYPTPEEPMRLAGQLTRLTRCLLALGIPEPDAVRIAVRAACDSVPLTRLRALHQIASSGAATVSSVHAAIGRGNRWGAKWELQALEAIGLIAVNGPLEEDEPGATRLYTLKDEYRGVYESVASSSLALSIEGARGALAPGEATDSHTPDPAGDAG